MACACSNKSKTTGLTTYKVVLPGGKIKVYSSEPAALAEAKKTPGAYLATQSGTGAI